MLYRQRYSPLSQLALLIGVTAGGAIFGSIITLFAGAAYLHVPLKDVAIKLVSSEDANLLRLVQFTGTLFFMAVPAILFTVIINRKPFEYLGFNIAPAGKQMFIIVGIVLVSLLISGTLGMLNELIPLSEKMETYFESLEKQYFKEVLLLTQNMSSAGNFILSLIILGLLPAVFEEMFFRGCVQQVLTGLFRSALAGIIITAILFSAIHWSFYGFLPRLFLGIMLGYIFYYSKNLWLSISAHFLNNAFAVTQMYALSRAGQLTLDSTEESLPLYYGLSAAVLLYFFFRVFKKESEFVISMHNMKKYAQAKTNEDLI